MLEAGNPSHMASTVRSYNGAGKYHSTEEGYIHSRGNIFNNLWDVNSLDPFTGSLHPHAHMTSWGMDSIL